MTDKSKQPAKRDGVILSLDVAIGLVNIGKEASSMTPAPAVFGVATILLTTIRDKLANERDCVDLGILCANVCDALRRGAHGKRADELSESVCNAIKQLETSIEKIQEKVEKLARKNELGKYFTASNDKGKIAGWRLELKEILQVFNTELALDTNIIAAGTHAVAAATHTIAVETHEAVMQVREAIDGQNRATESSAPWGELPPPPPKLFFGRSELVEEIVGLAEDLTSVALTGTGGIGKTSIVLAVLGDDRIKQRFGDSRCFIRCDKFPASHTHFLRKLSEVTGAGVENPEELSPLRRHLSLGEMIIVLDNAESILGLPETSAQEIHAIVNELSQFSNICLVVTSRISNTLPAHCEIIEIPTLSMEAGHETFHRIYTLGERTDEISEILKELDFHPLSLTLLATSAQQNRWNAKRITTEWEKQRTGVLRTRNLGSLAATVDLSLASPMFRELGSDAREVLGVVAFFPQGVDEDNVDRLFPTIFNGPSMFDTLCSLSLTHRGDGFITMLAPLRDHLRPKDPINSPLLHVAKEHYFRRLSAHVAPGVPGFNESKWIVSEDMNVEHLLDVFTPTDADPGGVWDACNDFMDHLFWHKPRLVILGPKIEALPDSHPSKPLCLFFLSRLFGRVGNLAEQKRVLIHSLGLWRERGNEFRVADTLISLAGANRKMGLHAGGVQQAREASEIFGRLGEKAKQAHCLVVLAALLYEGEQLDAAEEAASRALDLSGNQLHLCQCHRTLGEIHLFKGNTERAIHHLETALRIASPLGDGALLSEVHLSLAKLYFVEGKFTDAHTHIEHAKPHVGNDALQRAKVLRMNAVLLAMQTRFEEAKSEAMCALAISEKLGAANSVEYARTILHLIDSEIQGNGLADMDDAEPE